MKILNQKGNVLQITLIILLILLAHILTFINLTIYQSKNIRNIPIINNERMIEVVLIHYYKDEVANGILLSDDIDFEDGFVHYTVDDMGNYYLINTIIEYRQYKYSFSLELDIENLHISSFDYD